MAMGPLIKRRSDSCVSGRSLLTSWEAEGKQSHYFSCLFPSGDRCVCTLHKRDCAASQKEAAQSLCFQTSHKRVCTVVGPIYTLLLDCMSTFCRKPTSVEPVWPLAI